MKTIGCEVSYLFNCRRNCCNLVDGVYSKHSWDVVGRGLVWVSTGMAHPDDRGSTILPLHGQYGEHDPGRSILGRDHRLDSWFGEKDQVTGAGADRNSQLIESGGPSLFSYTS